MYERALFDFKCRISSGGTLTLILTLTVTRTLTVTLTLTLTVTVTVTGYHQEGHESVDDHPDMPRWEQEQGLDEDDFDAQDRY